MSMRSLPMKDEEKLQAAMVEYLELLYPRYECGVMWFHVPNQRMGKIARIINKYLGVLPGVPDLVFIRSDQKLLFVEVKTEKGRLSRAQKNFRTWCEFVGIPYAICRSLEDLMTALEAVDFVSKTRSVLR